MLKDLVEMPMHLADRRFQHAAMAVLLELPWILAAGGVGFMWISRKLYLRSNVLESSTVRLKLRVNLLFIMNSDPVPVENLHLARKE
jgi:hypothetical protein